MIKVSLVLPSLNVANYIRECIESVLAQNLCEIEIICVDAGSTDGTEKIIDEFASRDNRIRVIKTKKRSYGYQVNLGMEHAKGKYVAIVETDDVVPSDMYVDLYNVAEQKQVDFVKADFYRFKDVNGRREKTWEKLTAKEYYYGKVICPKDCKEVFDFSMNTWSGIYNLSFLKKFGIRHNESPGASFQDNGFWFQTFAFADRVYFVNKPYYLNRRDNPNSSVYSKGKLFAMADEYDFLLNILDNNEQIKKEFWAQYVKAKFNGYYFTLSRVSYEEKAEFVPRFAREFRKMIEQSEFAIESFSDIELGILFRILHEEKDFGDLYVKPRLQLYERIRNAQGVIIFGAGKYGKKFYDDLRRDVPDADIIGFAVTDVTQNETMYRGVKIYDINALGQYKNNLIIVALADRNKKEIMNILKESGFDNVEVLPTVFRPLA